MSDLRPRRRSRLNTSTSDTPLEDPMATQTFDEPEVLVVDPRQRSLAEGRTRAPSVHALPADSPTPTYLGIGVAAVGFVLIAFAWGQVAGETNVALQMPYLVSGGMVGLALVLVGLTIVNVAAKRRDAALRGQQTQLLADALHELRGALEGDAR